MPDAPNARVRIAAMILAATIGVAAAILSMQERVPDNIDEASPETATESVPTTTEVAIAENGRATIDASALPRDVPLTLSLALPGEARGDGIRAARIVSVDGRRLDVQSRPGPGAEGGIQLDIDPTFLRPGRYLVHVETAEKTPLHFRRYVLELK